MQVPLLAREVGLLRLGLVSVDGMQIAANADRHRNCFNAQAAVDADGSQLVLGARIVHNASERNEMAASASEHGCGL